MQILSIRGENIASLAKPFEIRLDEGPLASAGLFAITGETGAGKSSLLDTMCLALYGDCPRLSGGGTREAVEDVDGHSLKATDPRMVLRRGAARGLAEVTFRAVDGEVYIAGWAARRARDRIGGRLQSVDRSLVRAADGQVLESQLSRVNERVTELTGLTYDEFRRTVLLAQGDFDAFLSAQTGERAAILEKVTGTRIYREISRRVYDRHSTAQSALATLETRRGEHRLLSAEDRAALDTEAAALQARKTTTAEALAGVTADLARYTTQEAAQTALTRAEARLTAAERALATLAPDRAWLTEWDSAQALRAEAQEAQAATRALAQATRDEETLARSRQAQVDTAEATAGAARQAQAALEQMEAAFKALGPDWTRAEQLDSRITGATEEVARAEEDLTLRAAEAEAAEDQRRTLEARDQALDHDRRQAEQALAQIPGQEVLLTGWDTLEDRLQTRIAAAARRQEARTAQSTLRETDAARTRALDDALAQVDSLKTQLATQRDAQAALQPERAHLRADAPAEALAALVQQGLDLRALRQAAARVRDADRALADSARRREAAETALHTAEAARQDAATRRDTARHHVEALTRPAASAEAALSAEADHLRQHLQPGAPCPVCHATDHPVLEDSALSRLAEELRAQMEAATEARDAAERDWTEAGTRMAEARDVLAREAAATPDLSDTLQAALDDHARHLAPLQDQAQPDQDLPDLPEDPRAPDAAFAALLDQLDARRPQLEAARDRLRALDLEHERLTTEIDTIRTRLTAGEDEATALTTALAGSETRMQDLQRDIDAAGREIDALTPRLEAALTALSLTPEVFDESGIAQLDRLRETAQQAQALHRQITRLEADRTALLPALTEARSTARAAAARVADASRTRDARRDALTALQAERAKLLGGEATGAHRTRHNEARKTAQTAAAEAHRRQAEAEAQLAQLDGRLTSARQTLEQARERSDAATTALTSACDAAGLELARVQTLHATAAETVTQCRATLRAAETERGSALGARDERQRALAELRQQGLPETPRDTLEARKAELEAEAAKLSETLGGLSERRAADARARKALSGLEAEIEAARRVAETWTAINDAVGSARGDRFAQIAQAVTLRLLVERANLHLDQLKPRYQLAVADQDLALHVIDRDMAGDTRPSRLLSGGERFLVSLSLALALSGMGSRGALAGTLFIDEGFGSLDAESLDLAIDALERLQAQGRTIGVISHVQAMKDRIPVQLEVSKTGGGASEIVLKLG